MKTRSLYIILMLAAFALQASAGLSNYTKEHPLLFGMDMDYPPLEYIGDDGQPQGYDIEFTNALLKRLNVPFTYSPNSWENISDDVLSGRVDLAMMVYSPYRKELTNYSRAVFRLYYQIIFRMSNTAHFDIRQLEGKKVAFMSSKPVSDTLTRVGAKLYKIDDLSEATRNLSKGKYDAVICFHYQSKYLIAKNNLTNLVVEDLTLMPREYCYVSHDKRLIDAINVELDNMEKEGITVEIYGEVSTPFGGFRIPMWIWNLLALLGFLILVVFILVQQRYQRKLRREMEHAQLNDRMKTTFLGNVSHALRTPLNAIIGFSDLLKSSDANTMSDEERQQLVELINKSGCQLQSFINELLSLSDIEGKEFSVDDTEVHLAETMNAYANEVRPRLHEGVKLEVIGSDIHVRTDANHLRIVTKHLLENAVRYTEQGVVTLNYKVASNRLTVMVTDTGCGVPEPLRKNIFSLLSEKSTYLQDEVPGLGLTICRAIINRMGGEVGYHATESGGSEFWYWIPVKKKKDKASYTS